MKNNIEVCLQIKGWTLANVGVFSKMTWPWSSIAISHIVNSMTVILLKKMALSDSYPAIKAKQPLDVSHGWTRQGNGQRSRASMSLDWAKFGEFLAHLAFFR